MKDHFACKRCYTNTIYMNSCVYFTNERTEKQLNKLLEAPMSLPAAESNNADVDATHASFLLHKVD